MNDKPELPYIDTIEQAEAMGIALHRTRRFDVRWAPNVFKGLAAPHFDGKLTLNNELQSLWDNYMSAAERVALITVYVEERIKR